MKTLVDLLVPLHTTSRTNARVHWSKAAAKTKAERQIVALYLARTGLPTHARMVTAGGKQHVTSTLIDCPAPCVVTLTRLSEKQLDTPNLGDAMKAVIDELADWIGVDDRDPRVRWIFEQQKQPRGHFGVRIVVQALTSAPQPLT